MTISFFVAGLARPAGSKSAVPKRDRDGNLTGGVRVFDKSGESGKKWRQKVALRAREAYKGPPLERPLSAAVCFFVPRPRGHFGTGRNADKVKESAPRYPGVKPDATKLWRAAEDAMTGIIYADDALIVTQYVLKRYCDEKHPHPGVRIKIYDTPEL